MPFSVLPSLADGKPVLACAPAPLTLDAARAIALMDNSTELYVEIAQAYLQEIAQLWSSLERMLEQSQLDEATRTLHTFKGLSLTVGANLLSEVCRECELQFKALLKDQRTLDDDARATLEDALKHAVAQTQVALLAVLASLNCAATQNQEVASSAADAKDLLAAVYRLRALLAGSDMQAFDLHASLRLRYPDHQDALSKLDEAVKVFDFARAVVQCDELICIITNTSR